MNYKYYSIGLLVTIIIIIGCGKDDMMEEVPLVPIGHIDTTLMVNLGAYALEVETMGEGGTTIVYECGLGDNFDVWKQGVYNGLIGDYQQIIYNRAGYGNSTPDIDSMPRDIEALARDLSQVISEVSQNEKVILVGHSIGGPIIRSFVNLFPDKVEAMLFIDPSHEDDYDEESIQEFQENTLAFEIPDIPELNHIRREIAELYTNWKIMNLLPNLPDIPVTVLTAMSLEIDDEFSTPESRHRWYDLHESLGEGVTDFTHNSSDQVGHQIHEENPSMVIDAILGLIN